MFGYHSKQRIMQEASLLVLHSPKSHTEAIKARTANHFLRGKGERNGVQRRIKVSFGRTMMQALELLQLAKRHEAMVNRSL